MTRSAWLARLLIVAGMVILTGPVHAVRSEEAGDPNARYRRYVIEGRDWCFRENCHVKGYICCSTT